LRQERPMLLLPGDRFIIRQYSPVITIGGGIVLDAWTRRHRCGNPAVRARMEALESGESENMLAAHAEFQPAGMELAEIVTRTGWMEPAIRLAAESLSGKKKIRIVAYQPFVIVTSSAFDDLQSAIQRGVDSFHRDNPLAPGISKEELRARFARAARPEVFRAALDDLVKTEKASLSGDLLARAGRVTTLQPEEMEAWDVMAREFERTGLSVPRVDEALKNLPVEPKRALKLLQLLLRERVLVRISDDLVFHQTAIVRLRGLLAGYKQSHGERISVPAFKDLTGITRKYAIPLLEYLDRERLTRRMGDERVIL
jgi:selenocysteine-specific elongation factor